MSERKQLGGHAKKKIRDARDEDARRDEVKRRNAGGDLPEHLTHFKDVAEPPIGDPVAGVKWANDVAMILLRDVITDPVFNAEQRLRYASDLIGKLGMLHAKAHVQKRLEDLKRDESEEGPDQNGFEPNPFSGVGTPGDGGTSEGGKALRRSVFASSSAKK